MCCGCNCSNTVKRILLFAGVLVIFALAAFFGFGWPAIIDSVARQEFVLEPGARVYDNWLSSDVPMYFDMYFWDWTNPEDITNPNVQPHFVQRGPYVFLEVQERGDVRFNDDHTITFKQKRTWRYIPEQSNGDFLNDRVTTPHTMLLTVGKLVEGNTMLQFMVNGMIAQNNLLDGITYKNVLVKDIFFDGAEDKLLAALQTLLAEVPDLIEGVELPAWDGFGYFVERNTSFEHDGIFRMNTGTDDWSRTGHMRTWNNESSVPYFRERCGQVRGSAGQVNAPMTNAQFHNPGDFVLFITDVCSAISLRHEGDFTLNDLQGKLWVGDRRVFDNGNNFAETECQCTAPVEECPALKPGLMDVSGCNFGAPMLVSFPHFYLADPSYLLAVSGMSPKRQSHEFRYALHPFSGTPLTVNGRLQFNVHLRDYGLDLTKDVPDVVMPVFWVEQRVVLTQDIIDDLLFIERLRNGGIYTGFALFGVGILSMGLAIYVAFFVWKD
ncbi:protein croquemort-like [Toxorhynchites rutilus septentrionalis]|uniref:protein croquemort-like n=1 Tax=Toxorhynchites rutilus septentrionalis TaxID=329112 RepID=UPI002479F9F8|nr:protein croquemort-like [Toxorhynchites rutilus septentrionalis]XP_055642680.1 protein croquemort-like [Toxorhynchites rutilus septentrionalis]XP_055642681.1 protein croquemort-like [Toxorhynchites rutilus septentrionalis]XP_055642682.1 protein croquemort-like [Toxorhynchites rutilus septentrionalis]